MWTTTRAWVVAAGEWALLLPLWRRLIASRRGRGAAAIATAGGWLIMILVVAAIARGGDGDGDGAQGNGVAEARASATPTRTARPARSRTPSPAPSATPAATAQPTPGPPVAPGAPVAPTQPAIAAGGAAPAAPGQVLTIVSSTAYADDAGDLHVAGEVRNNGGEFMEFVEITGTFFDAAGQVIVSESTFTHADVVGPGEVAGFDLAVSGGTGLDVNRYELAVQGEVTAERPVAGLVVQGESTSVDEFGDLHIMGTVVNQSAGAAQFVKVIGTLYATDGTVLRSDFAYADLDEVPPGGTDTFDLVITGGGSLAYARYVLKVEGFAV